MRASELGPLEMRTWVQAALALTIAALAVPQPWRRTFIPPASGPVAEWPTADGVAGAHYSPLTDITPANVGALEVAWTYRTGDVNEGADGNSTTAFEATPIMVDGVLYLSMPFSRAVALDAETGRELWAFDPGLDRSARLQAMTTSRGVATWLDAERSPGEPCRRRVFLATYDGRLFALDGNSGMPCREFGAAGHVDLGEGVDRIEGRRQDYGQTAPPTIAGDLVIVGSKIPDGKYADAPSGVVRAFDARNGALRWSWEPLPGVGAVSENGTWIPAGAGNAWATLVFDAERDLVFVPTGSASPDHWGGLRPGENRYANSLVALRASTGEMSWHFQMVHHDLWDYDLAAPPALITVQRGGKEIAAVAQGTKMGYVFILDRDSGEPLFTVVERAAPASDVRGESAAETQPVPALPRPLVPQEIEPEDAWGLTPFDRFACHGKIEQSRSEGVFTPPSTRGSIVYPGFLGGVEWGGVAFDPVSGLLVTNTNRVAMVATLIPAGQVGAAGHDVEARSSVSLQTPTPYAVKREVLLSPLGIPCTPPPWGVLHAIDTRTGEVVWEKPLGTLRDVTGIPSPRSWGSVNLGGSIISGGLVFIAASMDRRIRAFELANGALAWEAELPASGQATPMTYRAHAGGRQYVVIAAGGHGGLHSALGDSVVAFALPAAARPGP